MLAAAELLPAVLGAVRCSATARSPEDTAAILFSSGSEGTPKGIELTHRNIMANVRQISDVLNTEGEDVILANLPLFHAFGLTVTTFMPLLEGRPHGLPSRTRRMPWAAPRRLPATARPFCAAPRPSCGSIPATARFTR